MFADVVTTMVWGALFGAAIGLVVLFVKVAFAGRGKGRGATIDPPTAIDIPALDSVGPPRGNPRIEIYGTPARVAIFVLAPVGRDGSLPPRQFLPRLVDDLVPGLMAVLERHQPIFRRWPEQLSNQGFIHSFFNHMPLPGDKGKGTPWCSITGRFESEGQTYLAGLVCCCDKPNGLSEFIIEHAGQWLDIVRVHTS